METFVVTYIGLPDMQYKDVTILAENKESARDLANIEILKEYGLDNVDCLEVYKSRFHDN